MAISHHTPDEIRELAVREIKAVWDTGWPLIFPNNSQPGYIHWPGLSVETPNADAYWAKMYIRHLDSAQQTFGEEGCRIFKVDALLVVNFYGPAGSGLQNQYALAKLLQDRFTGKYLDSDVSEILMEGKIRERGVEEEVWETVSFLSNFTYYEVR